jgi:hypothetical protein
LVLSCLLLLTRQCSPSISPSWRSEGDDILQVANENHAGAVHEHIVNSDVHVSEP